MIDYRVLSLLIITVSDLTITFVVPILIYLQCLICLCTQMKSPLHRRSLRGLQKIYKTCSLCGSTKDVQNMKMLSNLTTNCLIVIHYTLYLNTCTVARETMLTSYGFTVGWAHCGIREKIWDVVAGNHWYTPWYRSVFSNIPIDNLQYPQEIDIRFFHWQALVFLDDDTAIVVNCHIISRDNCMHSLAKISYLISP